MKTKVQIQNLSKIFSNGDGVRDINLDIYEHEILTLLGPSGCGKTTILRAIGGFIKPTSGQILIDQQDVTPLEPEHRPTGMVFQSYNLWPHMTVYENLAFGLKLRKLKKNDIKERIHQMLKMVKLVGMEDKFPAQLSGGQQQRIAIARSLLLEPEVLLLDEPFSALDAKIRQEMREELKRIQQTLKITVIFVTHDQEEAMAISDRIVVMNQGNIAQIGSPDQIYDHPENLFVANFIGAMNLISQGDHTLAIRPEAIKVGRKDQFSHQAILVHKMILGHYTLLEIEDSQGQHYKSYQQRNQALDLIEGDAISFDYDHSLSFNKEGLLHGE
ncbi:ABC transporter ATP-binding protein [Ignavigranum ruoffiae]|uniref:ABC-type quaternary amine transporter n=1 Tax=Ignavigranum ruoffiae TaxID=89093 RepID=A0A1H8ZAI4_9LACT|nr:ABC transporter ATP-binding protein [Ignavigranum ruoffiae]SEP61434.1 putative spermidine/putrescine transport system ATP-binding protein [Ignavigranum ruoffiae]